MAAPTTFRVEAISQTQTILRWVYGGTNAIGIYRSPDGVTYALVDTVGSTTLLFNDEGLVSGTKYWYKLSDDSGATFSSIVTVVTHSCGDTGSGVKTGFHLTRFTEGELTKPGAHQKLGKAFRDIEDMVKKNVFTQTPCEVCVVDGAIVINCADGCDCYNVDATTNINSISFINCDGIDPCINFKVPPNTTIGICGFPRGHNGKFSQFSGDECTKAPIVGGTDGKTVSVGPAGPPASKPGSGKGGGGSGVSGGCECVPGASGQLTVKCCSSSCSMTCASTKSLDIRICGGTGPYTISGSAGLQFKKSNGVAVGTGTIGPREVISITPPTNSGSAVAGTAYSKKWLELSCSSPFTNVLGVQSTYGCNDNQIIACGSLGSCSEPAACPSVCPDTFFAAQGLTIGNLRCGTPCNTIGCGGAFGNVGPCPGTCAGIEASNVATHLLTDDRTAPMIAAGCNPCGVSTSGKTITVTDAQGVSVVTILKA